jgi:ABC-type multidrug transport system ATPase subunit
MELELKNITKKYKDKEAVKNANVTIHTGVTGLLGANGAGKTTVMRMICGVLKPTEGTISFDGLNVEDEMYRDVLGYLPQDFGYYPNFKARDFLLYIAALKGLDKESAKVKCEELLKKVNLSDVANKKISTFSGGMKQRLGIAQALINDPKIIILDEPTAGLDPEGVDKVLDILNNLNEEGISIVISSHDIEMVNQFADKIFVLYNGEIIAQGDKHQIFSDKELLNKAHLKAPVTTEILYKLKENGLNVDTEKLSIEETVEEILKSKKS